MSTDKNKAKPQDKSNNLKKNGTKPLYSKEQVKKKSMISIFHPPYFKKNLILY